MTSIAIVYHSGYGHTEKVAESIARGVISTGAQAHVLHVERLTDADWKTLDAADAIIFGSPTYMSGVSGPFKMFLDKAGSRWLKQAWKDKLAAGFTNSGSLCGDKLCTLQQLMHNALQHGMIWVGQAEMPPQSKGTEGPSINSVNRLGSAAGLMTQSNNDSPEITPPAGDHETARLFGIRVAAITIQFMRGRAA